MHTESKANDDHHRNQIFVGLEQLDLTRRLVPVCGAEAQMITLVAVSLTRNTGGAHETHSNRDIDAYARCPNRLRTTEPRKDADTNAPQPSSTCSGPYFPIVSGAGVFRFQDGSLLTVNVTVGAICVDLTTGLGHLTETYQITGGTGRFKGATGTLALTGTLNVVLSDASGNPKLLTNTGRFEGTVLGVAIGEGAQGEQQ